MRATVFMAVLIFLGGCTGDGGNGDTDGGSDLILCSERSHCPGRLGCVDGFCGRCNLDNHCAIDEVCNPFDQLCDPYLEKECRVNDECSLGHFCVQGECKSADEIIQCGQDSDCNPSTVGSILGNFTGLSGIPLRFKTALDSSEYFSHTSATLDDCLTWCEDLAHGLGLWLYEYPTINRLWSFDYPMTLEKGMTMAVEAMEFDPSVGRTKLEEMIVVGNEGAEIMTKMPIKDMMVASPIITA